MDKSNKTNNIDKDRDNNDSCEMICKITVIIFARFVKNVVHSVHTILVTVWLMTITFFDLLLHLLNTITSIFIFFLNTIIISTTAIDLTRHNKNVSSIITWILCSIVLYVKNFFVIVMKLLIRAFVIPVIDNLYPVMDLETKFDVIVEVNIKTMINTGDNFGCGDQTELTQNHWNNYVMHLSRLKADPKLKRDIFDVMIIQQIKQINIAMTFAIAKTTTRPRYITYHKFKKILTKILGDAVNIKYRSATGFLFVGIFRDDGPYRRFRYYDKF